MARGLRYLFEDGSYPDPSGIEAVEHDMYEDKDIKVVRVPDDVRAKLEAGDMTEGEVLIELLGKPSEQYPS